MAKEEFDFEALKDSKFNQYKKKYCKPAALKKAKGGLVFTKFDLIGRKKGCLFLPFAKKNDARSAYERVKKDKSIHLVKHTAFVETTYAKAEDGSPQLTLNIIKGGLTAEQIQTQANELFTNAFKLQLKVTGTSDDSSTSDETTNEDTSPEQEKPKVESSNETTRSNEMLAKKKAKRGKFMQQMQEGVNKMDAVKTTASVEKMLAKIAQYEDTLDKIVKEAQSDGVVDQEEQKTIDTFKGELEQLKKAVEERQNAPQKLTPERRKKMRDNMDQISARLEAMANKLGI